MVQTIRETARETTIIRLLRCCKTQRFFTGDGWTEDASRAKIFTDEIAAARACVENQLENVELVLRAAGADTDLFTTPVR